MTDAAAPTDLAAAARTIGDADRRTRDGWPLSYAVTREVVVAATTLLAAVDALGEWRSGSTAGVVRMLQAERERDDARASLAAVLALHHRRPHQTDDFMEFGQTEFPDLCDHCRARWPCATVRATGTHTGLGAPSAGRVGSEGIGDAERPGEGQGA